MHSTSSQSTSGTNGWETQPIVLLSQLETIKADFDKTKNIRDLSQEQTSLCQSIIQSLENFIDPFLEISNHPLLRNIRLHDALADLNFHLEEQVKEFWENPVFKACGILATKNAEVFSPEKQALGKTLSLASPTTPSSSNTILLLAASSPHSPEESGHSSDEECDNEPLDEGIVDYLNEMNADKVVALIEHYASEATDASINHVPYSLSEKCIDIFNAIKIYLDPFQKIINCPVFKELRFYQVVKPMVIAIEGTDQTPLIKKMRDIFLVTRNADRTPRSSRSNSPVRLTKSTDGKGPTTPNSLILQVQSRLPKSLNFPTTPAQPRYKPDDTLDDTFEDFEGGNIFDGSAEGGTIAEHVRTPPISPQPKEQDLLLNRNALVINEEPEDSQKKESVKKEKPRGREHSNEKTPLVNPKNKTDEQEACACLIL